MIVIEALVLAFMLFATYYAAKTLGFNREDTIAIVFCGSKKSLAAGVPMAGVLFPGPDLGMILLPTMLFHQMQLMVCAVLARRWAQEGKPEAEAPPTAVAPPLGAVAARGEGAVNSGPIGCDLHGFVLDLARVSVRHQFEVQNVMNLAFHNDGFGVAGHGDNLGDARPAIALTGTHPLPFIHDIASLLSDGP